MELHHLKYFVKVAETLHFTRAADELFVTQPALSQQIKQLEEELGMALFYRTGRKIQLTDAGKMFLEYANSAIGEVEKGERAIANLQNTISGEIRIGVMYSYFNPLLAILGNFCKAYPEVNVNLQYGNNEDIKEMLLSSHLDLALSFEDTDMEGLEIKGEFSTQLTLAVSEKHELAKLKCFSLFDLEKLLLILPAPGNIVRKILEAFFKVNKIIPKIHAETNDVHLLLDLIEAGQFATIITDTATFKRKNIQLIPLKEKIPTPKGVILIRKDSYLNKAGLLLLSQLIEQVQGIRE